MNQIYQPLSLSHDLWERLERVFVVCYERFASQRSMSNRKRKFVSYPLFILHALQHLGVENVDVHFTPLKTQRLADRNARVVQRLLQDL